MVPLGSSLSCQFWNEEVESTRSLEASVRSLPREPPPLAMIRGSKVSRSQQLLLLQRLYGLPFAPSIASDSHTPAGVVLDRVIASAGGTNWWATLTGRMRVQGLFKRGAKVVDSSPEAANAPKWYSHTKRLLNKSLYALCMRTKLLLGANTSLSIRGETDSLDWDLNDRSNAPWRINGKFLHKMKNHDVSLQASWRERFMDRDCRYWDIPQAASMDISSVGSNSGLFYRLGVHHSAGVSQTCSEGDEKRVIPWGALPGTCAQGAVSFGKEVDIWKESEKHFGRQLHKPYNLLAARPHVTLSAIVGTVVNASLGQRTQQPGYLENDGKTGGKVVLSADTFGSLGLTAQFGLFQRIMLDHSKLAARVDFGSARMMNSFRNQEPGLNGVTFALSLQQQVLGPLRARVDSRFSLDSGISKPQMQEITYGLDCSLESLGAAKLVVWYCPTRAEGMAEIRILER